MIKSREKGVTIIEVVVAVSIIGVILVAVGFSVTSYVNARAQLLDNTKAAYLMEEGYEIIRVLRDDDWDTFEALALGDIHYLDVATTSLAFSATPEVIDGDFVRSFRLLSVYRDSDDDITSSTTAGANIDPELREVKVSVSGPNGTSTFSAILTNLNAL